MTLIYIILATSIVSLIAFIMATLIGRDEVYYKDWLKSLLIGLAVGTLLSISFLHFIPEILGHHHEEVHKKVEEGNVGNFSLNMLVLLVGVIFFWSIEKVFRIRHCHDENCEVHFSGILVNIGDSFHNFIDGVIIATSFTISTELGIIVTLSVVFHEIPQEISDVAVMRHSGMSYKSSIIWNGIAGLFAVLGGILGYFLVEYIEGINSYLVALGAASFIYIGLSDLLPSLHKRTKVSESMIQFLGILIGVLIIVLALNYLPSELHK